MTNIDNLKSRARTIQIEMEDGMNTSARVGGLLYDMISAIEDINARAGDSSQRVSSVVVTPIQQSGTQIANIAVDGRTQSLFAPAIDPGNKVSYTPSVNQGTVLGTITIDGVQHRIYTDITRGPKGDTGAKGADGRDGTVVTYSPTITSGTLIGTLYVDGQAFALYAPSGGDDGSSNVAVHQILKTGVPIADLTIDGGTVRLFAPESTGSGDVDTTAIQQIIGSSVSYSPTCTNGDIIGTLTINGVPYVLYAPASTITPGIPGNDGKGIANMQGYYLATTQSSGVTRTTSGWTTSIRTMTSTNKYLWYYCMTTFTDSSVSFTDPVIIGVYGDSTPGTDGKGIASMQGYYLATSQSSGVTRTTSGWTTSANQAVLSSTNKYLWYYCMTTFTDSSVSFTDPMIIGVYGEGSSTPVSSYDDTAVKKAIQDLEDELDRTTDLANSEKERLDGIIDDLARQVEETLDGMLKDAEWIQEHFPEGQTGSVSNFGESDVEAYLQRIGVWARNDDITRTQWSDISQKVGAIELSVNQLIEGEMDTEALRAAVRATVEEEVAQLDLSTMYAKKDAENIIEWLYSGLKSRTSADRSFNQLVSAGKNALNSAISEIRTQVDKLENGDYVATANLAAMVGDSISELYNQASASEARSTLFSTIKQNSKDIAEIFVATTGSSSSAGIAARLADWKAGLITTATLNDAIAQMEAGFDSKYASINAAVTKDSNGRLTSAITLTADKVTFDTSVINALNAALSINSLRVVNDNHEVAHINPDGRVLFNDGGVYIPTLVRASNGGTYEGNGVVVKDSTMKTFLQHNSLNFQSSGGTVYSGISCNNAKSIHISAMKPNSSFDVGVDLVLASAGTSGNSAYVEFENKQDRGDSRFVISNFSECRAQVDWDTISDARLKNIIGELEPSIESIANTRIVNYELKDNPGTYYVGAIAQDWQEIFPNAVKADSDTGYLGLKYASVALASAVTAAREIVALKARVAELESRLAN